MGKKSKAAKRGKPGQHAPIQGMGETYNWVVNDIAVINAKTTVADQVTLTIACDVNGYNYNVYSVNSGTQTQFPATSQGGIGQQRLYGDNNDQFTRLSFLWQEYRVNAISMHIVPAGPAGQLQPAANISIVDESGQFNRLERRSLETETQLIPECSSQKSVMIQVPYKPTRRSLNMNKWLIQTSDTCWQNTQDATYTVIQRDVYDTPVNYAGPVATADYEGLTPGLFNMIKFNMFGAFSGVICNVVFRTHYVFRQRRLLDPLQDVLLYRKADGLHLAKISDKVKQSLASSGEDEMSSDNVGKAVEDLTQSQTLALKDFITNLK